jgi:hypothetical protein
MWDQPASMVAVTAPSMSAMRLAASPQRRPRITMSKMVAAKRWSSMVI